MFPKHMCDSESVELFTLLHVFLCRIFCMYPVWNVWVATTSADICVKHRTPERVLYDFILHAQGAKIFFLCTRCCEQCKNRLQQPDFWIHIHTPPAIPHCQSLSPAKPSQRTLCLASDAAVGVNTRAHFVGSLDTGLVPHKVGACLIAGSLCVYRCLNGYDFDFMPWTEAEWWKPEVVMREAFAKQTFGTWTWSGILHLDIWTAFLSENLMVSSICYHVFPDSHSKPSSIWYH